MYKNVLFVIITTVLLQNKGIASSASEAVLSFQNPSLSPSTPQMTIHDSSDDKRLFLQTKAAIEQIDEERRKLELFLELKKDTLSKKRSSYPRMETIWAKRPDLKQKQNIAIKDLQKEILEMEAQLKTLSRNKETEIQRYQMIPTDQLEILVAEDRKNAEERQAKEETERRQKEIRATLQKEKVAATVEIARQEERRRQEAIKRQREEEETAKKQEAWDEEYRGIRDYKEFEGDVIAYREKHGDPSIYMSANAETRTMEEQQEDDKLVARAALTKIPLIEIKSDPHFRIRSFINKIIKANNEIIDNPRSTECLKTAINELIADSELRSVSISENIQPLKIDLAQKENLKNLLIFYTKNTFYREEIFNAAIILEALGYEKEAAHCLYPIYALPDLLRNHYWSSSLSTSKKKFEAVAAKKKFEKFSLTIQDETRNFYATQALAYIEATIKRLRPAKDFLMEDSQKRIYLKSTINRLLKYISYNDTLQIENEEKIYTALKFLLTKSLYYKTDVLLFSDQIFEKLKEFSGEFEAAYDLYDIFRENIADREGNIAEGADDYVKNAKSLFDTHVPEETRAQIMWCPK